MDGGIEICAWRNGISSCNGIKRKNSDFSSIAVVSALGDRQDQGERKSFTGKNFEIAEYAKSKVGRD